MGEAAIKGQRWWATPLVAAAAVVGNNRAWFVQFAGLLLLAEAVLNALIIRFVPYTEIDWVAYMEEVGGVLDGERDYSQLKGCTGPLVYPGGFVWIYSALHYLTGGGTDIRLAQYIFGGLYLAVLALVLAIYHRTPTTPVWAVVLLCLSKRIHSIFGLRLFNDCWAMFFMYAAILALLNRRLSLATLLYSFGVSVKMNLLLFLPGFGLILAMEEGILRNIPRALLFFAVQVGLGWPFLAHDWRAYMNGAFDLGRVFTHTWTVNWKFVPEEQFVSKELALGLLCGHLVVLLVFFFRKWNRIPLSDTLALLPRVPRPRLNPSYVVAVLFECNFIGVVFARSLHFQFFTWYFHSLPFLLWNTQYPTLLRLGLWAGIAYVWDTFPSTPATSLLLLGLHAALLLGLLFAPPPPPYAATTTVAAEKKKKRRK